MNGRVLSFLPFLLCAALYFPVLGQHLLSDDMAVTYALSEWIRHGVLGERLLAKFWTGLDSPSYYYRPLTFLSFGIDFVLAGVKPFAWHIVNLAAHFFAGAAVYRIARLLQPVQRSDAGPVFASALFLLWGTNVEAVAWISGRYDVFATALTLWASALYLRSVTAFDRHALAALACGILALCSKESAAVLPGLIGCLAWIRHGRLPFASRWRAIGADLLPWLVVTAAYFTMRLMIFGSMFQVYPDANPLQRIAGGEWLSSMDAARPWIIAALPQRGTLTLASALIVALALAGVAALVSDRALRRTSVGVIMAIASTLALLLPHLSGLSARGEGGRLFYTTGAWIAIWLALPLSAAVSGPPLRIHNWMRWYALIALIFVGAQAVLLNAALRDWRRAGAQMQQLVDALPPLERQLADDRYALVFAPDSIGAVPFARNANGAIVLPPIQQRPLLKKMLVFLPADIPAIPGLLGRRLIATLKESGLDEADARMRKAHPTEDPSTLWPTDFFCWRTDTAELMPVMVGEPWRNPVQWPTVASEALRRAGCQWATGAF